VEDTVEEEVDVMPELEKQHYEEIKSLNVLVNEVNPASPQTPEEMLERWKGVECTCDPSVGHQCEVCHDVNVLTNLIAERNRLREMAYKWQMLEQRLSKPSP